MALSRPADGPAAGEPDEKRKRLDEQQLQNRMVVEAIEGGSKWILSCITQGVRGKMTFLLMETRATTELDDEFRATTTFTNVQFLQLDSSRNVKVPVPKTAHCHNAKLVDRMRHECAPI